MNFLKKIWQRYAGNRPHPQAQQVPADMKKISFRSGWVLFFTTLISGGIFLTSTPPLGIALIGLSVLYLASCLHEIKSPNIAFLFRMGKFVHGMLGPGWYVTIPHFWDIEQIPTSWIQKDMKGDMYTKEKTLICVHGRIKYRVNKNALDKVLLMMPREMESRAAVISMSSLRGAVGSSPFETLVGDKGAIEKSIDELLAKEFEEHGYEYGDFKINDFDEQIQSEAEKIKILGKARGTAAEALATPLKDNLPAALANIASTVTESLGSIFRTGKPRKKEEVEKPEQSEPKDEILRELSENLKKLVGR